VTNRPAVDSDKLQRRAWVSIGSLLVMLFALQPVTFAIVNVILPSHPEVMSYQSWSDYLRSPTPDVVFIGTSRVVADVDRREITKTLSAELGRFTTVGFIGAGAAQTYFQEVIAYRVMHRPKHPRLVVLELSEFQYNANFTFDNLPDMWMTSLPVDAGAERLSLQVVPDAGRYLRGRTLPIFADYKLLAYSAAKEVTPLVNTVQRIGHFIHHGELADPYIDFSSGSSVSAASHHAMTLEEEQATLAAYAAEVLRDYKFEPSRLTNIANAVSFVQAAGAQVAFAILPQYHLDRITPTGYEEFLAHMLAFAESRHASLLDYHTLFQDDRALWIDPSHLNDAGRHALGPKLGAGVAPLL
jgi:hypothetical protein